MERNKKKRPGNSIRFNIENGYIEYKRLRKSHKRYNHIFYALEMNVMNGKVLSKKIVSVLESPFLMRRLYPEFCK